MTSVERLRYYFVDLPLWACGYRGRALERRLYKNFEPEIPAIKKGYETLAGYTNVSVTEQGLDDIIRQAFWVKIVRESDAYTCLRMSRRHLHKYFRFEGMEHLQSLTKENRPIIILTGHIGSFFIPSIAFHHLGFKVYPIARTVDTSPATPRLTRLYLTLNYKLSEKRFAAKYILSDFSGRIDRRIVSVSKNHGIFWVAIDFPWRVYQYKHLPVKLFGQPATLPSGIIRWGVKKNAAFLTGWNSVEEDSKGFYRMLSIDSVIESGMDVQTILQIYADRLSDRVIKEPWQWMALPAIRHYGEGCSKTVERDLTTRRTPDPSERFDNSSDRAIR
ncbi:MAG TPA: hypothetical protein VEI28_03190 [Thermodesulfovibrionales bacterium]|nr:hypothetical protein [Thermodesulfovibrionales bacterium]